MRLYHTLVMVPRQHENWLDIRHLYTLAWMIVGVIKIRTCKSNCLDTLCGKPGKICPKRATLFSTLFA